MFLKIFLISLPIFISTQAYSSTVCEGGFLEDSLLPERIIPVPNEIVIRNQTLRESFRYREAKIKNGVREWGENTLGRTLNEHELHLLEVFHRENPSSETKEKILRRRMRDYDQYNFSEREINILSLREIRPEFAKTVKIKVPERTQEEKELKAQGFNLAYRRGIDEVNEWIAVRQQLVRAKADPHLTHVDYFAKKMREQISYIEERVITPSEVRNLNRLKQYAEELINKKQVTYYRWLKFSLSLSKILSIDNLDYYLESLFYINHKIVKSFPHDMAIPTITGEMGIIAINKGSVQGIYPLGLKNTEDSLDFFWHDVLHFEPDRSSGLIYTKLTEHTKGLPLEKRKNIELAYFVLTHEGDYPIKISDPNDVLSKIQYQINMVVRLDNEEIRGLIDLRHDRDKKIQTVIADFLGLYHLIQREIEAERRERETEIEREIEADFLWMAQE